MRVSPVVFCVWRASLSGVSEIWSYQNDVSILGLLVVFSYLCVNSSCLFLPIYHLTEL